MIHYILTAPDGQIVQAGSKTEASRDGLSVPDGLAFHSIDAPIDPALYYWKDGLRVLPAKPNKWCVFDIASEAWIEPQSLVVAKATAVDLINRNAGRVRATFGTDIPFQQALYERKLEEAKRYTALPIVPSLLHDFPLIANEVGVTAPTAAELCQIWLNLNAYWQGKMDAIESVRMRRVKDVEGAANTSEIETLQAQALADLLAVQGSQTS